MTDNEMGNIAGNLLAQSDNQRMILQRQNDWPQVTSQTHQ